MQEIPEELAGLLSADYEEQRKAAKMSEYQKTYAQPKVITVLWSGGNIKFYGQAKEDHAATGTAVSYTCAATTATDRVYEHSCVRGASCMHPCIHVGSNTHSFSGTKAHTRMSARPARS